MFRCRYLVSNDRVRNVADDENGDRHENHETRDDNLSFESLGNDLKAM